jgi:hypothetical protein
VCLPAALEIEPWAEAIVAVGVSIAIACVVLLVVAFLGSYVLTQLNAIAATVKELEEKVDELRSSAVPAFTTFLGTIGFATSGLVVPAGWGALLSIAFAGVAFLFGSLAKDPSRATFLRWLYAAAASAPFVGAAIAAFASGNFGDLSTPSKIALCFGLFIGVVGLIGVIQGSTGRPKTQAPAAVV